MTTTIIFLLVIVFLLIVNMVLTVKGKTTNGTDGYTELKATEKSLKDEFVTSRKENADSLKGVREEVNNQLNMFTRTFSDTLKDNRKELAESSDKFKMEVANSLKEFGERQRDNFSDLLKNLTMQAGNSSDKLELIRETVEKKISELQKGNEVKLDEMRKTVDEKLNDTLEKRLGESFKLVSERLEAVHKGLGDMQGLAKDVGSLNKTMNNVKSRGVLGEYQLQNLLEDLLTNEQYQKNVKTKEGSGANVEFAIRMPNGTSLDKSLWLPIDSKFPKEDYEKLVDAYDKGDPDYVEECRKGFVRSIRKNAIDIKEKYIDPPNTTEYGLMFLPYESLYAEVLRTPGLFEQLQKDYKITITGPTTLSAFLNSLQMGFRTLAIEKRSSEVWDLLGAVKNEFGKFGEVLAKTKKKLEEATNVIDSAGVRSRAIERKLKDVQGLPQAENFLSLDGPVNVDDVIIEE
jgi:DNA recombination protein RmuC